MKRLLTLVLLALMPFSLLAQQGIKDTGIAVSLISAQYSYNLPGGDLADRFGGNSAVGGSFWRKTRTNWMFGLEYNYIFGSVLRENTILDSIATSNNQLISSDGQFAFFRMHERGHLAFLKVGKILPVIGPNPNSGLIFKLGAGFMEHKIKFYFDNNPPPQIDGDYYKGYDRLTNGLALSESIGFFHLDARNYLNFTIEFEAIQGFTQNRRDWNFDTRMKDDKKRLDLMFGLKAIWHFPLYGKYGNSEYY